MWLKCGKLVEGHLVTDMLGTDAAELLKHGFFFLVVLKGDLRNQFTSEQNEGSTCGVLPFCGTLRKSYHQVDVICHHGLWRPLQAEGQDILVCLLCAILPGRAEETPRLFCQFC